MLDRYKRVRAYIPKQEPKRYLEGIIHGRLHMTTEVHRDMPIVDQPDVLAKVSDALYEMLNTRVEFEPLTTEADYNG